MTTIRFERYEYKYFLPDGRVPEVRRFMAPYVRPDAHGRRYRVSNLYLDTPDLDFYREHERGAIDRFKLRIRTYGLDCRDELFFEVKRKIKNVIVKSRVGLDRGRLPEVLEEVDSYGIAGLAGEHLDDFRGRAILHGVRPVLLLEYDREAYESVLDDDARVTFDREIRYQPASELDLGADPGAWVPVDRSWSMGGLRSAALVELKFNTTCPAWMVDLVREFNLERHAFSKYMGAMTDVLERRTDDPIFGNVSRWVPDDE